MSGRAAPKRKNTPDDLIVFRVNDPGNLDQDGVCSEEKTISGIPWKLEVNIDTVYNEDTDEDDEEVKALGVYLICGMSQRSNVWFCDVSFKITLVNQKDSKQSVTNEVEEHRFTHTTCSQHGVDFDFLSVEDLLKPEKGFVKDNRIIVEAKVSVENSSLCKKFRPKSTIDLFSPSEGSDRILVVQGTKFHVNKQILALQSPFFDRLFNGKYKEAKEEEIAIEDVDKNHFEKLLKVMYPIGEDATAKTVEPLLELADRFEINNVMDNAEKFLLGPNEVEESKKLILADKYKLTVLLDKCIAHYNTHVKFRELKKSEEYSSLSHAVKSSLLDKIIDLVR